MQILDDLDGLLEDLSPASWRGVEFHMEDSRSDSGRRVVNFQFPGRDDLVHQDLGAVDGPIRIRALIVGDDYIRRGQKLRAACRKPGPGTLVHPWLGELQVVLSEPASIQYEDRRRRVVTAEMTFEIYGSPPVPVLDTLGKLLDAVDEVRSEARSMLRRVLSPLAMPLAAARYLGNLAASAGSFWRYGMALVSGNSRATTAAAPALVALDGLAVLPADARLADATVDRLAALPAAIESAVVMPLPPAIGPGGSAGNVPLAEHLAAQDQVPLEPRRALDLLLQVAGQLDDTAAGGLPPLVLAARVYVVAAAVSVAAEIPYESQQEALAVRARLDAALGDVAEAAARQAADRPLDAGPLWLSLTRLRAACITDLTVRIGRLPAVTTLTPPGVVPGWLVAQHLAGDDATRTVPLLLDLLARNGLRRPWAVPPRPLEVLP